MELILLFLPSRMVCTHAGKLVLQILRLGHLIRGGPCITCSARGAGSTLPKAASLIPYSGSESCRTRMAVLDFRVSLSPCPQSYQGEASGKDLGNSAEAQTCLLLSVARRVKQIQDKCHNSPNYKHQRWASIFITTKVQQEPQLCTLRMMHIGADGLQSKPPESDPPFCAWRFPGQGS